MTKEENEETEEKEEDEEKEEKLSKVYSVLLTGHYKQLSKLNFKWPKLKVRKVVI